MLWVTGASTEGLPFIHDSFPANPKAVHHQRKKPPPFHHTQKTHQHHHHGDKDPATTTAAAAAHDNSTTAATNTTTNTTSTHYNCGNDSKNDVINDGVNATPLPPPPSVVPTTKTLNYRDLSREVLDAADSFKLPAVYRSNVLSNDHPQSSRKVTPREGEQGKGPAGFTGYMRRYKACARIKGFSPNRAYCSTRSRAPPSDDNNMDGHQILPAASISKDSLTTTPVPLPTLRSQNTATSTINPTSSATTTTDDRLRPEHAKPQSQPSSETPLPAGLPELVPAETNGVSSASAVVRGTETGGEGSPEAAATVRSAETNNGEASSRAAETNEGSSAASADRDPGWNTSSELRKQVEEKLKRGSSPDYGEGAAGLYSNRQGREGSREPPRMRGRRRVSGGRGRGGGASGSGGGGAGGRLSGQVSGRSVAAATGGGKRALGDIVSAHRMHELLRQKDDRTLPYTYYRTAVSRDAATLDNVDLEAPRTDKQPQTARL